MKALKYVALIGISLFVIIIVVSNNSNPTPSRAISFAKDSVSKIMKDPDSVKFDSLNFYPEDQPQGEQISGHVCGYLNAKNSFGAYTGRTRFVSGITVSNNGRTAKYSQPVIEELSSEISISAMDALWDKVCK
ncbi:TPA: hypothetical protein RUZ17_002975 [Vibrio cholerae]|nr:hypothetical protein [Vibrio cholerae]